MKLDRVAEDVFVLISELYAQVTATVLLTDEGAVVVDTLPFPNETRQVVAFIEGKLGPHQVRYVINSHHHADHTYGNYQFVEAEIIAHDLCREALRRVGQANLERGQRNVPALAEVELRLPDITIRRELHLHVGHRNLILRHTPGHTPDSLSVLVMDERVLVAGDTIMPVPHIVAGNYQELRASLLAAQAAHPSFIVQGHGDVLLHGEIDEDLDSSIGYLDTIVERVRTLVARGDPPQKLREISIESCGKSRIPLDGLVSKLHWENLVSLYKQMKST